MKISLVCVGKLKEPWLKAAVEMYAKRISKFAEVEIVETNDFKDTLPLELILQKEAEEVLKRLPSSAFAVLCDLQGHEYDSLNLAQKMQIWMETSGAHLYFLIGGSNGVSEILRKKAAVKLKLSALTFPHQLTRVILLEQIYRSFKIQNGESYHK